MSRRAASIVAVGPLALHLVLGTAFAQSPLRLGAEFQINTHVTDAQYPTRGSVSLEDNGDFVVVWISWGNQDGSQYGVFGQRYSSSGTALGSEFQVNAYTTGIQQGAVVAADSDGDFVVAWRSAHDGAGYGVFARRFNSSGAALASEFQVNLYTGGSQWRPTVARDADGDFVVAWQSYGQDGSQYGVFGRRFNAAGAAQGAEFQVNTFTNSVQKHPAVDLDADGDFVIAWDSVNQDGIGYGVFGQRFNSAGAKQGPEFQANVFFTNDQEEAVVGLDANGDFVIAWRSLGQDSSFAGVFARRFDSSGAPLGAELQVNTFFTFSQTEPSIAVDSDGDFVVAWASELQDGSFYGVFARHFRGGVAIGDEIPVNSTVAGSQRNPAVGADADGDFVIAWSSFGQDGSSYAVIGQRFDVPALLDIDANGQITPLTDGLLVLRFLFGFSGATLTAGAVGPNCARCDSAAILPYLQSLT